MTIQQSGTDTMTAAGNALSYVAGNCTRWVAENLSWVGSGWGNASEWLGNAQAQGLSTSRTPSVGSVAVWGAGSSMPWGHVAVVTGVDQSGGIQVSEENWLGYGRTDLRSLSPTETAAISGFIQPPGGGAPMYDTSGVGFGPIQLPPIPNLGPIGGAIGGIPGAAAKALTGDVGPGLAALGNSIASVPTNIGHGIANATGAGIKDVEVWAMRNAVALFVALAVTFVLFGGAASQPQPAAQ